MNRILNAMAITTLDQSQLGDLIGRSQPTISRWLSHPDRVERPFDLLLDLIVSQRWPKSKRERVKALLGSGEFDAALSLSVGSPK